MKVIVTAEVSGLAVTIEADSAAEAVAELTMLGVCLPGTQQSLADAAQPAKAKAEELDAEKAKDKALRILAALYKDMHTREATRALLPRFGVKKFGDVPLERAHELLAEALTLTPEDDRA